jgi:hypothetical protein
MITHICKKYTFKSVIDYSVGDHSIHTGDYIEATERGDGLWDVLVNNDHLGYAVIADDIDKLAGEDLTGF